MKSKLIAPLVIIASAFMYGCNQTDNSNMANANANANTRVATSTPIPTATASPSTRRAPTREEYERDKERYNREAKETGRTIGTGINDGWLWAKARFDLAAADDLRDSTINVDVNNSIVTLTGTVASQPQIAKADQIAKAVEGVKGVKNMLKVAANASATPTPAKPKK
jgi:osmotically-inducible protein OsmY